MKPRVPWEKKPAHCRQFWSMILNFTKIAVALKVKGQKSRLYMPTFTRLMQLPVSTIYITT